MRSKPCAKSLTGIATLVMLAAAFSCTTPEQNQDSGYGDPNAPDSDRSAGYGGIPNSARRVADGYGRLRYRADRDATIWVGNESRGYVVVSRRISDGDEIEVIPDRNRVEIDGRAVYEQDMESGARHAIFISASGNWNDSEGKDPYGEVPRRAQNMASGTGRIEWRVDQPGRVWIGDDRRESVVIAEDVRRGDLVEVNPGKNQVKINGRIVFDQNMESKHQHSIFFADPGSMGGR